MTILELKNLTKSFDQCVSYHNMNLTIKSGEVHAILGENGAGKSTLMKTIYGIHQPDKGGEIFFKGKKVTISTPKFANDLGIGMVHQHFMLVKPFTVLQNIILGVEPKNKLGVIDYKTATLKIKELTQKYNLNLDLNAKVESISVGMQQRVEIIKTLYRNAELIILDEPTAVLTPQEIVEFYKIIENLKNQNKTILIITHKLHEIKEIADRCTIIRKGEFITTVNVNEVTEEKLASLMVGREVGLKSTKSPFNPGDYFFEIKDLNVLNNKSIKALNGFNLKLSHGEIYGLSGIDGNGQTELVESLVGLRKIQSGSISIQNKNITNLSPKEIFQNKISVVPADRIKTGLVVDFKVKENFILQRVSSNNFSNYGILLNKNINQFAQGLIERFDIRPNNIEINAANLSGGNQQKIILAREIERNPELLVCFQPTRGLDVGAIEYIHKELLKLRDQNKTVLLISYELDEIINLSDRIGVIEGGKLVREFSNEEIKSTKNLKETIGYYMANGENGELNEKK